MGSAEEEKLLKSYRRKALVKPQDVPVELDFGRNDIERILPHRDPFLLLDHLSGLDREKRIITGSYRPSPESDLFKGHFPDYPVYPGSLQVEAVGQLGLCLVHFIETASDSIGSDASAPDIRATRVCGAFYRGEVRPGDTMTLMAQVVDYDAYFGTLLGQVLVDGNIATVALLEVTFL